MPAASRRPADEGRLLQLVYYAYVAGSRLALAIPERLAYRLVHACGSLWWRLSRKRRAIVQRNLARITGNPPGSAEVARLSREASRSYARYWLETFRLVREGREFFLTRFVCPTEYKIDEVMARGKGCVVVVGHLGNWDAAGAWAGARGNTLVTVAEVLRPRRMFEFFADHRARLGMVIHPDERGVTAKLVQAVEDGAIVAILGDRDLKGTGPRVDFFAEPAHLPAGPASVALRAGVPLLVAGVYSERLPDGRYGWWTELAGPIELPDDRGDGAVQAVTEEVAVHLERFIARRPEEWHVFQPFWPADRTET